MTEKKIADAAAQVPPAVPQAPNPVPAAPSAENPDPALPEQADGQPQRDAQPCLLYTSRCV